ncbi:MAG: hypothetical protein IT196_06855 [Acidimicrobiales bacterium]|nr:hypothetical protein [Acidimicrobiales bacterium]
MTVHLDPSRPSTATGADAATRADVPSAARSLPAGLADVALASATSFVIGIDAARHLDVVSLGLWGLIFSAYLLAAVVPTEFILVPLEAALVSQSPQRQLRSVPRTLIIASLVGIPASVLAMTLAASFSSGVPSTVAGRTALIGVLLGVTSPLQDHVRRLMHQAGWSAGAAMVSACQVVVAVVAVIGLHVLGVRGLYIPPLALALSNLSSLTFGVIAARRRAGPGPGGAIDLYRATRMGSWLLGAGVADRATQFACLALLSLFVGNVGVGQYESTRVAAQPVLVFALGVLSVYRRPMMRSAQERDRRGARRAGRAYAALVFLAAGAYAAVAAVRWQANPLPRLTPAAYDRAGFLVAVLAATAVTAIAMAPTSELVGAGWAKPYARQIVVQAGVLVALCLGALTLGAGVFAWPIALGGRGLLLVVALRRQTRLLYGTTPGTHPAGTAPAGA